MSYAVGSLVRARGREWVVLPESRDDLLMLRPLGGTDLLLIHIEVQSQRDPAFPLRMLYYHAALRLRYDLPVTSLTLLADPVAGWKPLCSSTAERRAWGVHAEFAAFYEPSMGFRAGPSKRQAVQEPRTTEA